MTEGTAPDVVVVGAGPAGSSCALELARQGVAVTIVERTRFPRTKVCGEYLNAGALGRLDELGLGGEVRHRARPLRGVRLFSASARSLELDFPEPAFALPRATLDALLLAGAIEAGAAIVHGRVEDVICDGARTRGVSFRGEDGAVRELRARFVVGADGVGSIIARKLGLLRRPGRSHRFALGGHYRGFGGFDGYVEMYVGSGAYFALNPLEDDLCNVMVVVRERELASWARDVDGGVRGKAAELGRGRCSFDRTERVGPRVSVGPLDFKVCGVAKPGALLAGDAAGFLNPFTGQGVFLALSGGIDAAQTIAATLAESAREAALFAEYERRRCDDFLRRRRVARAIDALLEIPYLARRASERVRRFPGIGARLMRTLSGAGVESRAFDVWRLVV